MEFKDRIKILRREKNMTQSQLAAVLGKSEGAVRAWEIERSKPDADTLITLANYFECTTDYLLGLNDYKNLVEQNDIDDLSKKLSQDICQLEKGKEWLAGLVDLIEIALDRNQQFIATSYLVPAKYFAHALGELFSLQDEFAENKSFDFVRFMDVYRNMSVTATIAKKNMQLISSYPLPWITGLAHEYGTALDKKLADVFFGAYHNKGYENTTDIWETAMEEFSKKFINELK